jgi:hypothetical protein
LNNRQRKPLRSSIEQKHFHPASAAIPETIPCLTGR